MNYKWSKLSKFCKKGPSCELEHRETSWSMRGILLQNVFHWNKIRIRWGIPPPPRYRLFNFLQLRIWGIQLSSFWPSPFIYGNTNIGRTKCWKIWREIWNIWQPYWCSVLLLLHSQIPHNYSLQHLDSNNKTW